MATLETTQATGLELQIHAGGVAAIEFNLPDSKVNKLTGNILMALDSVLASLEGNEQIRGVMLTSGKPGNWIAGADIEEIRRIKTAEEGHQLAAKGQRILERLARLRVPTVAVINGSCLGGGLELALACRLRVATTSPRTMLGLPEVRLGIVPGFGGTQRLPRLIGLPGATDLILSGRSLDGRRAERMGLVDLACPPEVVWDQARTLLLQVAERGMRRVKTRRAACRGRGRWLLALPPMRSVWFRWVRHLTEKKTGGNYPAPMAALRALRASGGSLNRGLSLEAHLLGEMAVTDTSRNLVWLFFLNQAIKRNPGISESDVRPRAIRLAAVLGAGAMGGGISQVLSQSGARVRMRDIDPDALARGMGAASSVYRDLVRRKRLSLEEARHGLHRIGATLSYDGFRNCGLVVEAVVEDLGLKRRVLEEVSTKVPDDAIIASNTSSLSIDAIAEAVPSPERVAGWHFFNPVHRMPLVEVIRGRFTSPEAVATLVALTKKLGKIPLVVRDRPGFLVNRILTIYLMEGSRLFEQGAAIDWVDSALERFGMPMGPAALLDQIGIDVAAKVSEVLGQAFPHLQMNSDLMQRLVKGNRLGKKTGSGFYTYSRQGRRRLSKSVYSVLDSDGEGRPEASQIQDRLILPMVNEACRVLAEGIVPGPSDVDTGMIYGAGFPPFRGGLLRYADALGPREVVARLERLADIHGERYAPCAPLRERGQRGERFYAEP
ncbi:MAG: 3-hydroxyacyl-CoA dehydrogenase NAD-binding domain-containing protein [Acidobacteria bacterium]|nr:3-hydroxyacyl-CoA dehydrogenase NAD-binding domain-containing protein [Acidobacteriota bacterium]